jgi:hypothetical protein
MVPTKLVRQSNHVKYETKRDGRAKGHYEIGRQGGEMPKSHLNRSQTLGRRIQSHNLDEFIGNAVIVLGKSSHVTLDDGTASRGRPARSKRESTMQQDADKEQKRNENSHVKAVSFPQTG